MLATRFHMGKEDERYPRSKDDAKRVIGELLEEERSKKRRKRQND